MKRRGFLKSLLGVAALAAHAKFGSLVPIAEPEVAPTFTELLAPGLFTVNVSDVPLLEVGDSVMIGYEFKEVLRVTRVTYGAGEWPTLTVQRG